ncbi:MAG: relaxase/mobilization nuclease domain-containing protein [Hyphomicrobiaceae bacterium]
MIGKVPKAGQGFRGLVNYLLNGDKDQQHAAREAGSSGLPASRVAWSAMRNMLITDPNLAPGLMRATAHKSKRVKSPVYHYVISWHPDEAPTDDFMQQVCDVTCDDLGLQDYQRLYIAHRDTDHHHVHIVVNRVHPETGTAWNRRQDWVRIEQSLRRQSENMGLEIVPGRHTDGQQFRNVGKRPSDGALRRKAMKPSGVPERSWTKEMIRERREALSRTIDACSSWSQLDRALSVMGYRLHRKGQGLVIADAGGTMKLSDVGKTIRLKALEARFGQTFDQHETLAQMMDDQARGASVAAPVSLTAPPPPPSPAPRDTPMTAGALHRAPPLSPPSADPDRERTAEKYTVLAGAKDKADLAEALRALGLASVDNVRSARAEVVKAMEDVEKEKSVLDQLISDLAIPGAGGNAPKKHDSGPSDNAPPPQDKRRRSRRRR